MGAHDDGRLRAWEAAGQAAAALVKDGDRVGIGTGRAAAAGIRALGERVSEGLDCVAVPTSAASRDLGRQLGIRLGRMDGPVDIAFDGADIVVPSGLAIKGGGGALVRERIVGESARRLLILVDAPKVAETFEPWGVLPVAVIPFAAEYVSGALADLSPTRRPGRSDDQLVIIDFAMPVGADWEAADLRIRAVNGVVDTGLFRVNPSDVLVGAPDGSVAVLPDVALPG